MTNHEQNDPRTHALDVALQALEKKYGKGAVMRLGGAEAADVPAVSTGSFLLDQAIGVGGYPRGRVVEVFGPESSGKTTLALHAIAQVQARGGIAAMVDAEHALDVTYAKKLGVDLDRLLVAQPDSGEQALEIVEGLVRSGAVDLVVVDSVAALVPQAEIDGDMGDAHVGLQARLMSQALRKLTSIIHKSQAIVLFINQIRQKIGVAYGSNETTTGGNALKFYASLRLEIRRTGSVSVNEEAIGNKVKVKVVKNKVAPPFRQVELEILFGRGVCQAGELIGLAEAMGVITKNGSWYSAGDLRLGQGREQVREVLLRDADLFARLSAQVRQPAAA